MNSYYGFSLKQLLGRYFAAYIFLERLATYIIHLLSRHSKDGEGPQNKQLQEMFDRLAGNDKEIDAEELQDILTISLKQGVYFKLILLISA